ncbi:hypothetical protein KIN20_023753 [Parelaphostrongylus tenuis]|uniref:Uncharacterized protein n=1 Tax=Parelaphostrongylus tenuis TaxID=148309 RepID=A0AAD5NCE0_PARTN|nr:hypothetical protein KIN20_023753 [Parelaphostrongylus tenuis]
MPQDCTIADNTVKGICPKERTQTATYHKHHHGELVENVWNNVLYRAVRMLESGPFVTHYSSAVVSVGGN